MAKTVDCGQVNPTGDCHDVIEAATEEELMRKAREHAIRDHGMQFTPDLEAKVRSMIQDK